MSTHDALLNALAERGLWADLVHRVSAFFTPERIAAAVRAAIIVFLGILVARYGGRALAKMLRRREGGPPVELFQRLTSWGLFLFSLAWALQELGFRLGVLLGAAGVVTVAIGFASQTSLSNLISGFFLFGEQPFRVGDLIEVDGVTGEVLAIDWFSTKIRTFTNHYVRIPNESMFKNKLVNMTRFPIRRVDFFIPVAYGADLKRVKRILLEATEQNAVCLQEPAPLMYVSEFTDSSVTLQFSAWTARENYLALLSSLPAEVMTAMAESGVPFPYRHRVIHTAEPE